MYQFSDSDTTDSDDGIRFKTATTRHKHKDGSHRDTKERRRSRSRNRHRSRSKSRSPRRYHSSSYRSLRRTRRSRSRSYERNSQTQSNDRNNRYESHRYRKSRSKSRDRTKSNKKSPEIKVKTKSTNEFSTNVCGPTLPPHLTNKEEENIPEEKNNFVNIKNGKTNDSQTSENLLREEFGSSSVSTSPVSCTEENSNSASGPKLPPGFNPTPALPTSFKETLCGPFLPPQEAKVNNDNDSDDSISDSGNNLPSDEIETEFCGPALPPHLLKKTIEENTNSKEEEEKPEEKSIGPFIPEHLRKQLAEQQDLDIFPLVSPENVNDNNQIEEIVEHEDDDNDDVECYGPMPAHLQPKSQAHIALEERALQMKLDLLTPQSNEPTREEWMLELPAVHSAAKIGLGPRQFRAKAGPDLSDRSSWTDTPNNKKSKTAEKVVDVKQEAELMELKKRDEEQEAMVKKSKKKNKRDKSLLEQHQEKLNAKKKADKDASVPIRRPFNRDIDLKVNQFDDAQKKAIMKKAQLLDDRFSQGQAKFL